MAGQSFWGQVLNEFRRVNMVYPSINYYLICIYTHTHTHTHIYIYIYILKKNNHKTQKKYYLIKK